MHIHFIGICGTFMAGLARIAQSLGHEITGSDRAFYPPMSTQIDEMGVTTYQGFGADIWDVISPDLVIVGNVCSRGMPIIEAMLNKNIPFTSGPAWLGEEVLKHKKVFAIAGTHGKTTTSAMLTHILNAWDKSPSYLVGGVVNQLPHSSRLTESDYFVIEADEYDSAYFDKRPKFMHYNPYVFAVGSAEFDHADIYEHVGQIENQFHYGIRNVIPNGLVILGQGEHVENIEKKGIWSNKVSLSRDFLIKNSQLFDAESSSYIGDFPSHLVGLYNQQNALVACLAATQAGLTIKQGLAAMNSFAGVKRRLEKIISINDINVYDDFAHHPTAVRVTLTAMRDLMNCDNQRLICVLEPRSNSMKMGVHKKDLEKSVQLADKSYLYVSDSDTDIGVKNGSCYTDIKALVKSLIGDTQPGDEIVIMSNGDFNGIYDLIKEGLNERN